VGEGQNGFLIDANKPSEYATVLRQLLSHQDTLQQFRQVSLQKAYQFDIKKVVEKYGRIFREVAHAG
jgi:glycosyltransferase involved in cell wall biosynthesis